MRRVLVIAGMLLLASCSAQTQYVAPPLPSPPLMPENFALAARPPLVPSGVMPQEELLRLMASDPIPEVTAKVAEKAVQAANARSVVRPTAANMNRAVVIYPHHDGAIYEIITRDSMPTSLVFSEPEEVKKVSQDDFFQVFTEVVGEEPHRQWHVVLIPKGPGLDSTMTILTTQGPYHLKVVSTSTVGMIAVRWKHPASTVRLPKLLNPGIYYTGYDVKVNEGAPEWTPTEVWDTGLGGQTLIRLPERASVGEIPTFYVLTADGKKHLTNWEKRGDWYVVPRLITRGELRLGHESEVVTIARGEAYHAVWCPSPVVTCPAGGESWK